MPLPPTPTGFANRGVSVAERSVDFGVHIGAIVAGLIAFPFLFATVAARGAFGDAVAMAIYAAGFFALFGCSGAYNFATPSRVKERLRGFDHASIFLMIAGTYTAVLSQAPATRWTVGLGVFVWTAALAGAATRIFLPGRFERGIVVAYLALGWSALPAIRPLAAALPSQSCALVIAGGALYSVGVAFHLWESLRFHSAIWHGFVAAAAGCQFAAVWQAVGR
jgi:hemolysin III